MPVTIAPGSGSRLRRSSTGFLVRIDAGRPTEDVLAAVRRALADVRTRLLDLDDPDPELGLGPDDRNEVAHVSDVLPTPTGAAIYVDGGDVSPRLLVQVLDRAVEDLVRHEVADAVVSVPGPSPVFEQLVGQPCGPRLSLTKRPPRPLDPWAAPPSWADRATEWLLEDPDLVGQGLRAVVSSQEFRIGPADIATVLDLEHAGRIGARSVVAGDPGVGVRTATYESSGSGVLTLGSAGAAAADPAALERRLITLADTEAAHVDYAWLELSAGYPLWFDVGDGTGLASGDSGRPPRPDHMWVIDEVALDAFPFQVLGPGHLHRLGSRARRPEAGRTPWSLLRGRDAHPEVRPLADGRLAWRLGSTEDWADERRAARLRRVGRRLLAPILLDRDPLFELSKARLDADMPERRRLRDEG